LEQLASKTEKKILEKKNAWSDDEQLMQTPKKRIEQYWAGITAKNKRAEGKAVSKLVRNDRSSPSPCKHEDNMDKNKERTRKQKQPRQRQKERLSIYNNNNKKEKE
jgi:hypothetical protein